MALAQEDIDKAIRIRDYVHARGTSSDTMRRESQELVDTITANQP